MCHCESQRDEATPSFVDLFGERLRHSVRNDKNSYLFGVS